MIPMNEINKLINKYYKRDGKNRTAYTKLDKQEKYSNEYKKERRLASKEKHRYLILQELTGEVPFHITKDQLNQIEYWITSFNDNFKNFHRRSSEETIILAFIMIQYKQANPNMEVDNYSICKKYKLNQRVFELIQNRLIFELMRTVPMTYNQSRHYNHHILMKGKE